ncbi:MAG: DNA helicase PcrA [Candidatus Saganbacteria bacterium]|nr:DNA helicase PcrA [Candidatus Saganbacteria bacterium]
MKNLDGLNDKQKEAVLCTEGPLLVIAGAGSGKTRAITHRIAYLIQEKKIAPSQILAVTFTNKAAKEMKERLAGSIGVLSRDMWIGTFHFVCGRILRKHIDELGWNKNFVIYDEDDQLSLIKKICGELELEGRYFKPQAVLGKISSLKNNLVSLEEFSRQAGSTYEEKIASAYRMYQERLFKHNALDFDDMLNFAVELLSKCPKVLEYYQDKFHYVHVDEYQDTNKAQYLLTHLLAGGKNNLCVVGDEDQSIYSWRGADFRNILNFEKNYPNAKVIKLEENYRSTQNILEAANQVIRNNTERKDKSLWTKNPEGAEIIHYQARDERDEAGFIASQIKKELGNNFFHNEFVVLYRTNAQSRVIEEVFLEHGIPYRIIGGFRFYERREIKDIIAYLRVILNPEDDLSLERILFNFWGGIGKISFAKIDLAAKRKGLSLFKALSDLSDMDLSPASKTQAKKGLAEVESFHSKLNDLSAYEMIERVIIGTGYKRALEEENDEESLGRLENIKELMSLAREFEVISGDNSLAAFLSQIALVTDYDRADESQPKVTLMTFHSAKGLEFKVVFMAGMEEGVFPHRRSLDTPNEIEEERRLCYVGITRAKQKLFFISASERILFGETWANGFSRFLEEIPEAAVKKISFEDGKETPRLRSGQVGRRKGDIQSFKQGDFVLHPQWGTGEILEVEQDTDDSILSINFYSFGRKNLSLQYAPLTLKE